MKLIKNMQRKKKTIKIYEEDWAWQLREIAKRKQQGQRVSSADIYNELTKKV